MKYAPDIADRLGVFADLPFEHYVELDGAHSTALKRFFVSAKEYKHGLTVKLDKDTLRQGRAFHTASLEPDRFILDYAVWKDGDRRGKAWEAFKEFNAGSTIITLAQYETACRMRDALFKHKVAGALMREAGRNELTLRWVNKLTGIVCKARIDRLTTNLIDLKSTSKLEPRLFSPAAASLGYPMQLALYREGVRECLGIEPPTKIIAVDSAPPYDVVVYNLPLGAMIVGEADVARTLETLKRCRETDEWPGIAEDDEVDLVLPQWASNTAGGDASALNFNGESLF